MSVSAYASSMIGTAWPLRKSQSLLGRHRCISPTPSSLGGPDCRPMRRRARLLPTTRRHVASHLPLKSSKRSKPRKSMDLPTVLAVSMRYLQAKTPIQKEVAAHCLPSLALFIMAYHPNHDARGII